MGRTMSTPRWLLAQIIIIALPPQRNKRSPKIDHIGVADLQVYTTRLLINHMWASESLNVSESANDLSSSLTRQTVSIAISKLPCAFPPSTAARKFRTRTH